MIRLKELRVQYGEQRVLDGFSLDLPDKGRVALMGPSGCGKSTLLIAMAGLIPHGGEICGLSNRRIGVLFQDDSLLPSFSAVTNVAAVLPDDIKRKQRLQRARELLSACGLPTGAYEKTPDELSGGMKKRVALARLLGYNCDVWLLDEPFGGLDAQSREELMALMIALCADKLTVIVSHDPYEASALGERTILLDGPPLRIAEPGELFDKGEA